MSKSFLTLSLNPAKKHLNACWLRPVNSQEYRHGIRMIGLCISALRIKYALTDFSRIGTPLLEDQVCTANFLKQALQNTSLERCARILSCDNAQWQAYERIMEEAKTLPYETCGFKNVQEAQSWLLCGNEKNEVTPEHLFFVTLESDANKIIKQLQNRPVSVITTEASPAQDNLAEIKTNEIITIGYSDFLSLKIDACNSLLTVRWLRPVQGLEYRNGIQKAGHTLLNYRLERILINNQRLGVPPLDDQNWLTKTLTDIVAASHLKRIAIVTSNNTLQQLANESVDCKIKSLGAAYKPCYFFTEEEAFEWLMLSEDAYELRSK